MPTCTALPLLFRLGAELGLSAIYNSSRDTKLLCLQRFVRLFAFGLSTLILVLYLSSLGIPEARIGLFMTLTLLGDVASTFCLTLFADSLGRRKTLMLSAALMSASGVVFALSGSYWALVAASVLGIISPRSACPLSSTDTCAVRQANHVNIVARKSAPSVPLKNPPSRISPRPTSAATSSPGTH